MTFLNICIDLLKNVFPCVSCFKRFVEINHFTNPQFSIQFIDQTDSSGGETAQTPQTPHTADCISKIQAIQRDVLDLMCAVEQFGGKRGDKDYNYLDEMLTRNLLKLDTIDTNGKESIRLARKEAIKCIQASIAVLEAKSDLHLNEKQEKANETNPSEEKQQQNDEKPSEKMNVEETVATGATESNAMDTTASASESNATNEIPKEVQQNIENITIDDEPKDSSSEQDKAEKSATDSADANKKE